MSIDAKDLLVIKNKLESAKKEEITLKARKSLLMEELNDKYGCKTIKDAKCEIKKLETRIADMEKEIDDAIEVLEHEFSQFNGI